MLDTSSAIERLFEAEKLRDVLYRRLEAMMIANASFKIGDLVKQKAGNYSRERGPGRVTRVIMKRARSYKYDKVKGKMIDLPDTFSVEGYCYPLKKDGEVAKVGEFSVDEENIIVLERAKEE